MNAWTVLENDRTVVFEDIRKDYGERRFCAIGKTEAEVLAVVVYTLRKSATRIISFRKANEKEQRMFYEINKSDIKEN